MNPDHRNDASRRPPSMHRPLLLGAFLLAVPVSMVKNGFRIMVIGSSLNEYGDNWFIHALHRKGGIVFFVPAVATLILLLVAAKKLASWLNVERTARFLQPEDEKTVEEPH